MNVLTQHSWLFLQDQSDHLEYLRNEASVVDVAVGQQDIEAGEVPMQDVHAVQMGHAAGHLPSRCQNRHQVRQAMHGGAIGPEPAPVNAILQSTTHILTAMSSGWTASCDRHKFCVLRASVLRCQHNL